MSIERPVAGSLTPTQKAFADRILRDVMDLLDDNDVVLDLIRGTYSATKVCEKFVNDLYAGVANYDMIRTEQLRYTQEELTRIMMIMPQPVGGRVVHEDEAFNDAG